MHRYLFDHQKNLDLEGLRNGAATIGLHMANFDKCLDGQTNSLVSADIKEAQRLGVRSTPTFFVGRIDSDGSIDLVTRFTGAAPFDAVNNIVNDVAAPKRTFWFW